MTNDSQPSVIKFIEHEGSGKWFDIKNHPTLYYCRFRKDDYVDDLYAYYRVPFPESLKNAVIKRRAEFLAGRYCASKALNYLGLAGLPVGIGKHRNPLWPPGVFGAISHSNGFAVAVISPASETLGVGIDIEELVPQDSAEQLQSQVLFGRERFLVAGENKALLFTLAFSAKESFFKAAYPKVQEYFDFDAVSIVNIDLDCKTLTLEVGGSLGAGFQKGQLVTVYFNYLSDSKLVTLVSLQNKTMR